MVVRRSRTNYLVWLLIFIVALFVLYQFSVAGRKRVQLPQIMKREGFENKKDGVFAFFYADWCGHCQRAKPAWNELENNATGLGVNLAKINSDEQPDVVKQHGVSGFPTIRYYPNGMNDVDNRVEYSGERTYNGFKSFLQSV